jgi:16S rRNA (guanine527-N7)-methyltransferase
MKGKPSEDELSGVPADFAVRETHVLAVPGLDAERRLVVLGRA